MGRKKKGKRKEVRKNQDRVARKTGNLKENEERDEYGKYMYTGIKDGF